MLAGQDVSDEPRDLRREPLELAREPRTLPRLPLPHRCAATLELLARAAARHAQRQYAADPVALTDFGVLR